MSSECLTFFSSANMLATTASKIIVTINMEIAMQSAQSIDRAALLNKLALIGYIGSLVVVAILTFLSWWAGSHLQDVMQKDADARIAEADSKAAVANESAGKANERAGLANAEAARANEGLAQSNLEIVRLTAEAEKAKAERADADKQIAIAKADAARAKEGIANAEARSLEASAEVSRLRVTVANAETARAKAEKALLELQQRLADRVITDAAATRIIARIRKYKDREFDVVTYWDDREPLAIANRVADVLIAAGWKLDQPKTWRGLLGGTTGILVYFHPEASPEAKQAAEALVSALNSVGLSAVIREQNDPGHPSEKINLNVGTKPR